MIQIPAAALVRAVQRKHEVALRGILCAASIIGFSHFANAEPVSWPLKKTANNSHLVDQNDKPFFINGWGASGFVETFGCG